MTVSNPKHLRVAQFAGYKLKALVQIICVTRHETVITTFTTMHIIAVLLQIIPINTRHVIKARHLSSSFRQNLCWQARSRTMLYNGVVLVQFLALLQSHF